MSQPAATWAAMVGSSGGSNQRQATTTFAPGPAPATAVVDHLETPEAAVRERWAEEQNKLHQLLHERDIHEWAVPGVEGSLGSPLRLVGGVDISFVKDDAVTACASLVVLELPSLEVVYKDCTMVEMREPYIPGFLAFREVNHLLARLQVLRTTAPHLVPQVILVDGNGILHVRGFGLASHLGVLADIPTIGVGKKLFHLDGFKSERAYREKEYVEHLQAGGDYFPLVGRERKTWGAALRVTDGASRPVYVSIGHRVSLETAIAVVMACSQHRIPEPVRQADLQSRGVLRRLEAAAKHGNGGGDGAGASGQVHRGTRAGRGGRGSQNGRGGHGGGSGGHGQNGGRAGQFRGKGQGRGQVQGDGP
eukprot:m.5811 g.5811  ORF g.5811 m.5811 type:complete len:364 (+) comp2469_c0_seq1:639-1730(+)